MNAAGLAHDLFFAGLPCKGGPGKPRECDLDAPCFRHSHLFESAERILRRRAQAAQEPRHATIAKPATEACPHGS